jgi:glycosyltransferase involved in cell wall biosynthesis
MKLSIIIPSYQRPLDLKRCLTSVEFQTRPADEVVVVVRDGDVETLELISVCRETMKSLRTIPVEKPGLIAALNSGIEAATGDILVFTDDDSEAQPNWLELIEASFAEPEVGAVGGRDWLQFPEEIPRYLHPEVKRLGVLSWYGKLHGNHHRPLRGHRREVMFLKGVNMAFRRGALGTYRIDPNLHGTGAQVGSEIDLCGHVREMGLKILFDDRILVKHYSAPRPKDDIRTDLTGPVWQDACFNTHYLIAKHFGIHRSLAYFCHGRLLGSRYMPGLFASLRWSLRRDWSIWKRLWEMTSVAWAGFLAGRHMRTASNQKIRDLQPFTRQGSTAA